jgi:ribonuclease-3
MKRVKEIIKEIEGTTHFQQAFIHISFIKNKTDLRNSYETLEFLGDSILNFSTALFLFHSFPHYSEGQMSKLKQLMVQESTLTHLSKEIGLDKYLKTGKVEKKNHRISKDRILADIFESFLAALYLEKGEKIVHEFLSLTLFLWVKGKENMI